MQVFMPSLRTSHKIFQTVVGLDFVFVMNMNALLQALLSIYYFQEWVIRIYADQLFFDHKPVLEHVLLAACHRVRLAANIHIATRAFDR